MYISKLEGLGARVSVHPAGNLDCVLSSQVARLVTAHYHPVIQDEDIVITADVDGFIMSPRILDPLQKASSFWVWGYDYSRILGVEFQIPLLGTHSRTWKELIEFNGDMRSMIQNYNKLLKMQKEDKNDWFWDQNIVSYSLLTKRICSLPDDHEVWTRYRLKPQAFDDSSSCWHGNLSTGMTCCADSKCIEEDTSCMWMHLYSQGGVDGLEEKYQKIIALNSK